MLSVLEIFKIGLGPSSSHTTGPMRIAARVVRDARDVGVLSDVTRVIVSLRGSLALTGVGHAVDKACILGLSGADPEDIDPADAQRLVDLATRHSKLNLGGEFEISFEPLRDIQFEREKIPELHPNEMHVSLLGESSKILLEATYYSVGGGFIASAAQLGSEAPNDLIEIGPKPAHPFGSARDLLAICKAEGMSVAQVVMANEDRMRPRDQTLAGLDRIWEAMSACIDRGLATKGKLPGGLEVSRRAPGLHDRLHSGLGGNESERLLDWLNVYALAVNEENAAGGKVVTAPTNGAAGILPAVMRYYCIPDEICDQDKVREFLLTAGGIGILYKQRASISGAEMGCQGEVGVACSMAAAGLAAIWGGSPPQVEHAAEIAMEHNLGLTCDPVGGLVQIPCIERNALGAVKAVNAARMAIIASDEPKVSLDQVIETMRQTGLDMSGKYKETSQGGLAVNVIEC